MNESKRMPGEWLKQPASTSNYGIKEIEIRTNAGSLIAITFSEANARLIAAVPDLLAVIEAVIPDLEHYVSKQGPGPDKRLEACIAAIKKARGE